jgi:hypothetical protein
MINKFKEKIDKFQEKMEKNRLNSMKLINKFLTLTSSYFHIFLNLKKINKFKKNVKFLEKKSQNFNKFPSPYELVLFRNSKYHIKIIKFYNKINNFQEKN